MYGSSGGFEQPACSTLPSPPPAPHETHSTRSTPSGNDTQVPAQRRHAHMRRPAQITAAIPSFDRRFPRRRAGHARSTHAARRKKGGASPRTRARSQHIVHTYCTSSIRPRILPPCMTELPHPSAQQLALHNIPCTTFLHIQATKTKRQSRTSQNTQIKSESSYPWHAALWQTCRSALHNHWHLHRTV
jgi:hypothetical protein